VQKTQKKPLGARLFLLFACYNYIIRLLVATQMHLCRMANGIFLINMLSVKIGRNELIYCKMRGALAFFGYNSNLFFLL
jgi:hypothetical protein